MEENNLHTTDPAQEQALHLMEGGRPHTTPLPQIGEECLQHCSEIAATTIALHTDRNTLNIDTVEELKAFRRTHPPHSSEPVGAKRQKRVLLHMAAGIAGMGIAAAVMLIWLLRLTAPAAEETPVHLFRADSTTQQTTLQVEGESMAHPLPVAIAALPPNTAMHLSPHEADYRPTRGNSQPLESEGLVQIHRLNIPRGETFKLTLADGTEVLLNADSRLIYPTRFGQSAERIVRLEGEAYFKVAPDSSRPFVVKSGNVQVRVLGTEFNVRNYPTSQTRVTLVSGKVALSNTHGKPLVEMEPGQCALLAADDSCEVAEADIESLLYWKEGYFYFDDVSLAEMMKEVGRWYNIDILFRHHSHMELRMHFFAHRHRDITHLIEMLNRMERIHAYMKEGKLIIE